MMNETQFDTLVRTAAGQVGRRDAIKALVGVGLGLAFTSAGWDRTRGFLTGPPSAAAAEQQTAVCYAPTNAVASGPGSGRLAETFVASTGGKLSRVQLDVYKPANTTGDYLVHLLAVDAKGKPINKTLAKAKIYDSDVAVGTSDTVNAHFRKRKTVTLKAGKRYAVAVSRPGPNGIMANAAINGCIDNRMFRSDTQTAPFVENPDIDLRVAVFVGF
jgi:hypothetical protein